MLFTPEKLSSSKVKKLAFCKGVSAWFLSKNRPFWYMIFLSKQSKKEIYFNILDSKESFFDLKSETLPKSKKLAFSKGLVHGFCQKIDLFLICFF